MTETAGVATATFPGKVPNGTVGGPVASIKIKLKDREDMGYVSTNNPP
jgi:long-subunit acyl-CoA synthetase (AMP-forming)